MFKIYKQFANFIGEDRRLLRRTMIISLVQSLLEISKLAAIYLVLKAILAGRLDGRTLLSAAAIMLAALVISFRLKSYTSLKQTEIGYNVAANKRLEIGEHLKYVPMGFFTSQSLGRIVSVASNTCSTIQDVATLVLMQISTGLGNALIMTLMLCFFNIPMALLSAIAIVSFFMITSLINRKGEVLARRKVALDQNLVDKSLEYIQGMAQIKAFNPEGGAKELNEEIERNRKISTQIELHLIPYLTLQSLFLRLLSLGMIALSLHFCFAGSMELADSLMIIIVAFMMFSHLEFATAFASMLKLLKFSMDKVDEISALPVMDAGAEDITPSEHTIRFEHVDFSYEKRPILRDVNLVIPEKTTTAIVGPSGSGKTTLTSLTARFWDVDAGRITLDGRDLRDYTLNSLWDNLSMVFQNVYLFNDTIANNIRFGSPDATDQQVYEAADRARCLEFIDALPQGFDTMVGEGGASLSGGEAQRLSIARAILKNAPIIILDEATANIDPENEAGIQEAIRALTHEKTVIMIAHRLKTVENADQIVVLNNGRIEDVGTHTELLSRDGTYKRFIDMRRNALGWKV